MKNTEINKDKIEIISQLEIVVYTFCFFEQVHKYIFIICLITDHMFIVCLL